MMLTTELPSLTELLTLYNSVGWTRYTSDAEQLHKAVKQSSYVICARMPDGRLAGLARALSDDVSICYLQDLLVHPSRHRQGVGRSLMKAVLIRYAHVMQQVLITGDEPGQLAFYHALGFHNTRELKKNVTNCYYRDPQHQLS